MSDRPSTPDPDDPRIPDLAALFDQLMSSPDNPELAKALESMGISGVDPSMVALMSSQLKAMMNSDTSEGINIEMCTGVARSVVAAEGDAAVGSDDHEMVSEAVKVAALWIDQCTRYVSHATGAQAMSRSEWIEATMPVWASVVEPVAKGMSTAMTSAMQTQWSRLAGEGDASQMQIPGLPAGINPAQILSSMEPMLRSMSSAMFSTQCGQAVGQLSREVVSGTDVGIPLLPRDTIALVPANIRSFGAGLDLDPTEVRLFLAVRETARCRLFAAVPWLASHVLAAVDAYARGICIDTDHIESQLGSIDINDAERLQELMASGVFAPQTTDAQKLALSQLETLLALIEGWVEVVTEQATHQRLPHAAALTESVRRRRASGGPAEHTFATLVGLELRPRRLRDAANLFRALEKSGGVELRDSVWDHPDVAPTSEVLDDILGYVERRNAPPASPDALDEALERMLSEGDQPSAE